MAPERVEMARRGGEMHAAGWGSWRAIAVEVGWGDGSARPGLALRSAALRLRRLDEGGEG
jgi:hypothetical protein